MPTSLRRIGLVNFGPYRGHQDVRLDGAKPIVVVHGANMSGKTSLFNAIRWALYGTVKDRIGQDIRRKHLVNKEAAKRGDWKMSVTLAMQQNGTEYELTRAIQPRGPGEPSVDSDFDEKIFLQRDGFHVDARPSEINQLLPERIARFFLFDGEQLDEYERLLADKDEQAATIRDSIEDILGVPALSNAIADLRINHREAARRQQNLARKDQAAKVFATIAANLDREIEEIEADIRDLQKQREDLQYRQSQLAERLRLTAAIESEMDRLDLIRAQLTQLDLEQQDLSEERRARLVDAWKDLVVPRLSARLHDVQQSLERNADTARKAAELRTRLRQLTRIREEGNCPVCGSSLDRGNRRWSEEVSSLEAELRAVPDAVGDQAESLQSVRRLTSVRGTGAPEAIRHIERRLLEIRTARADLTLKREEIEERLRDHADDEIARSRREYDEITKEIGVLEETIKARVLEMAEKHAAAAANRQKISKFGGPELERLNREVAAYDQLIAVFQAAISQLRDRLRSTVEHDATTIFRQLTTDKSYRGLRISPTYALTIVDADGDDVPVRAAGAEQIVALSLIGALNKNAVRRGPIVMDTPFGRLDPTHRENILKFVPTMADQVTLLVHAGEVDRGRDLASVRTKIEREYSIVKKSSNESEIVVLE